MLRMLESRDEKLAASAWGNLAKQRPPTNQPQQVKFAATACAQRERVRESH
jgi:hypothetical protein